MWVRFSPQSRDESLVEKFMPKEHERVMDQPGHYLVACGLMPGEALPSVDQDALDRLASPGSAKYLTAADHRMEWQQVMEHGINLDVVLLSHFGTTKGVIRQGPIIHNLAASSPGTRLRRAHPCRKGISIWRPVRGGLGPENGLFKVYLGSHHIRTEKELRDSNIKPVEIRIRADQALITQGLWIEEGDGVGILMWMGVSVEIVGLHIDQYCLAFIAGAYKASSLLWRCLPPRTAAETELAPGNLSLTLKSRNTVAGTRRSETAKSILDHARENLFYIQKFLTEMDDPTGSILLASDIANDPRIAYLSVGRDEDPQKWFIRALTVRNLVLSYHTRRSKSIAEFLNEEALPTGVRATIQYGDKVYSTELALENPGIWLALMKDLLRFKELPLSETEDMQQLLSESYQDIVGAVSPWTKFIVSSCRFQRSVCDGWHRT